MKTIAVPVNFSNNSSNAARYAADLALSIQGRIHLIYVLEPPAGAAEIPLPNYAFEEMQRSGEIMLSALTNELVTRTKGQVYITTTMEIGGVEKTLEEVCKQINPFMVVMGASGHTFENAVYGSSTVRAMRSLPFPILIIPEKVKFQEVKKIVLACEDEDILAGLPVSHPFLKELTDNFGNGYEVLNIHTKSISEGINQYLGENPTDWLIVFPKKHSFFEFHNSQSKKIARNCPVPVMSIHQ